MVKPASTFLDKFLAWIYFIGFEVALYFLLTFLLLNQVPKNPDKETVIVNNWNSFIFFVLLYIGATIGSMLLLTSALPRRYKPLVMQFFWWSWLGLAIMLVMAFS